MADQFGIAIDIMGFLTEKTVEAAAVACQSRGGQRASPQ